MNGYAILTALGIESRPCAGKRAAKRSKCRLVALVHRFLSRTDLRASDTAQTGVSPDPEWIVGHSEAIHMSE